MDWTKVVYRIESADDAHRGQGTGFAFGRDADDALLVVTCWHVVREIHSDNLRIKDLPCEVVSSDGDDDLDLAVLRVAGLGCEAPLSLAPHGAPGQAFDTYGYEPIGRPLSGKLGAATSRPHVSRQDVPAWDYYLGEGARELEKIKDGYSGAPVCDRATGGVIAVITHRQGTDKGFAIDIANLPRVYPQAAASIAEAQAEPDGEYATDPATQTLSAQLRDGRTRPTRPRIFISYAQYEPAHSKRVLALAVALAADGLDVELDQFHGHETIDWPRWCEERLEPANTDFVLLICTAEYRRRIQGKVELDQGRGVFWEGNLIYGYLYRAKANQRFVPLLIDEEPESSLPAAVANWNHFSLQDFGLQSGDAGYEGLYRLLTNQPATLKPTSGELVRLRPAPLPEASKQRSPTPPTGGADDLDQDAIPKSQCADPEIQALSDQLDAVYGEKNRLIGEGADTAEVQARIMELKRRIRQGGHLHAGDFLLDGRYKLIQALKQGGFGTIFRAVDTRRRREVAVKVLHGQYAYDRSRRERFFRGARKMAELQHQGIVQVLDPEQMDEGHYFFVMEYLPGGDLRDAEGFIDRLPIPIAVKPVLARAIAWNAEDRYESIPAFCAALRQAREQVDAGMAVSLSLADGEPTTPPETKPAALSYARSRAWDAAHAAVLTDEERKQSPAGGISDAGFAPSRPTPFRDPFADRSGDGPEMIWLSGGTFRLGSPEGVGQDDERPAHDVTLSHYAVGKYPVTVGEFRRFVEATGYRTEAEQGDGAWVLNKGSWDQTSDASWRNPYMDQDDRHPVVCISWNDAKAYCDWMSEQTGQSYGLLTEAQWEHACTAGSDTAWCFGDSESELDQYAWFSRNAGDGTRPVGEKRANAWQLHDMHGNCWEWCEDWFERYSENPQRDPSGPESGSLRVVRGGSWRNVADDCRSAFRDGGHPSLRRLNLGFRLSRTGPLHSYPFTLGPPEPEPIADLHDRLRDGGDGPAMVWLPGGLSTMGQDDSEWDDEKPAHPVRVDAFSIGRYPLTFEEYDRYCKATGREAPNDAGWGRGKRPVINVRWEGRRAGKRSASRPPQSTAQLAG